MVCPSCKDDNCERCVDRLRAIYADDFVCECTRNLHTEKRDGEARLNQIKDPETGTVYAPGLTVDIDGKVTFKEDPFGRY